MKAAVIKVLEEKFKGKKFTFFCVMTWAPVEQVGDWKRALWELIEEGYLEKVEQRPLGAVYQVKG